MSERTLVVYENRWIIEMIYRTSDNVRDKLTDQTLFEERCIKRISKYLNLSKGNVNNKRYINRLIHEVASAVIKRNKNEHARIFTEMSTEDGDGSEIAFEPEDVLTDVESEVITKETIALLTQDDRSKKVLEAWSIGNTNNTEISRMLTHTLGGKTESHRKFIQRFERDCREKLATAI